MNQTSVIVCFLVILVSSEVDGDQSLSLRREPAAAGHHFQGLRDDHKLTGAWVEIIFNLVLSHSHQAVSVLRSMLQAYDLHNQDPLSCGCAVRS